MDKLLLARVQASAGELQQAETTIAEHQQKHPNEVLPLAHLVEIQWRVGKKDEARETFEQLRLISSDLDMSAPAMSRLAPVAAELGYEGDWRSRTPFAADPGERPDLDSLGPFRWHPWRAPEWSLLDAAEKQHALDDYRGRPLVIIFYLGYGCLHCAEQLQAFAPRAAEFEQAGLSLIAISTDDRQSLTRSLDTYKDGEFPFPLVSDEALDVFRAYGAYDDFERMPLHATFVIDGNGLVRWQDIGYEPFMDPDFVLSEARRLLSVNAGQTMELTKPANELR